MDVTIGWGLGEHMTRKQKLQDECYTGTIQVIDGDARQFVCSCRDVGGDRNICAFLGDIDGLCQCACHNSQGQPKRVMHMAGMTDKRGRVSALCSEKPRAINLNQASWTTDSFQVTCAKCLELLGKQNA